MPTVIPEGDAVRKAVKWVSAGLQEHTGKSVKELVNEAVSRFDLSPRDAEFLIRFYRENKGEAGES